jgi:signal transduction histidine kinase
MADATSLPWNEPHFQSIFLYSSDPLVLIDDDGRVIDRNRAARNLCVDVERVLDPAGAFATELAALRADLRSWGTARVELRVPVSRGQVRQVAVHGRASHRCDILTVLDETDKRSREDELHHLRALESVGFLTASIVHDFNNLLFAIVGSASALARFVEPGTAFATIVSDINEAAERATTLVRQILDLAGGSRSGPQTLDLSAAVAEMVGLLRKVVGDRVELELSLGEAIGPVVVDRERLQQALLNVAANARDAMPKGGKLRIATSNVNPGDEPDGPADAGERFVVLTASDEGVGMSAEVRDRMFERFYTTKGPGRGTGLGLATVHRFVIDSGGSVTVQSAPGKGTRISIYFPRASSPSSATLRQSEPQNCGARC